MSALLPTRTVEKPWGRTTLPAPFQAEPGTRIGEIWFEPPPQLPELLVKHIFTSEALSVQVHPSDAQTEAAGLGRQGKEECWLVTSAEPGASLGIGFREEIAPERLRAAALDGSIEQLMVWHPVKPGDFFYIPANTVHAIGAGIGLVEVQQNSDITYRLYDYGRPRELHLEQGFAVAKGEPYPARLHSTLPAEGGETLVDGPLFRLDLIDTSPGDDLTARYSGPLLVIPMEGEAEVGCEMVRPGQCAVAEAISAVAINGRALIAQPCR